MKSIKGSYMILKDIEAAIKEIEENKSSASIVLPLAAIDSINDAPEAIKDHWLSNLEQAQETSDRLQKLYRDRSIIICKIIEYTKRSKDKNISTLYSGDEIIATFSEDEISELDEKIVESEKRRRRSRGV